MNSKIGFFLAAVAVMVLTAAVVFAQGKAERYGDDKTEAIDGMATRSIVHYPHTKADVSVSLTATGANAVSKVVVFCTKALTVKINGTGDARTIPANTEWSRTVRKGVTSLVFGGASSASTNIQVERQ